MQCLNNISNSHSHYSKIISNNSNIVPFINSNTIIKIDNNIKLIENYKKYTYTNKIKGIIIHIY